MNLPQIPILPPVKTLEDADKAIQALLEYLDRLRREIERNG